MSLWKYLKICITGNNNSYSSTLWSYSSTLSHESIHLLVLKLNLNLFGFFLLLLWKWAKPIHYHIQSNTTKKSGNSRHRAFHRSHRSCPYNFNNESHHHLSAQHSKRMNDYKMMPKNVKVLKKNPMYHSVHFCLKFEMHPVSSLGQCNEFEIFIFISTHKLQ